MITSEQWSTWSKLQGNGMVSYMADPEHNLSVGSRKGCVEFVRFCDFHGMVLDVGCGPQTIPAYMSGCVNSDVLFVGIDPFIGLHSFNFVCGLAEHLPFHDGLFDQVLFATSLDHFIDIEIALREAKRVMKDTGNICIWHGEKNGNDSSGKTNEWYENLVVPEGAQDRFHYRRFMSQEIESYASGLGLAVINKETYVVDDWRRNVFICLGRS